MCPGITDSCCKMEDQLNIYSNWKKTEEEKVRSHYKNLHKKYEELLRKFIDVEEIAKSTQEKLKFKKISNCKILGERILNYSISDLESQITQNLSVLEEFFTASYKGLYCSLCDSSNHRFITEDSITYSKKFCRDMVEKSLNIVIFFKSHIVKYGNILAQYLLSCDKRGHFLKDQEIPNEYFLYIEQNEKDTLTNCMQNRNDVQWFFHCSDICQNFDITEFPAYFEPQQEHINKYLKWLDELIEKVKFGVQPDIFDFNENP